MKTLSFYLSPFAFCLLSFSSCLTVKRIERNCDKFAALCAKTETVIIKRDTTIYRHDTVFFQLPADTLKITDTIRIENNRAILKPVHKRVGLIWVDAWINNNWLNIAAGLTDSTILIPTRDTIFFPDIFTQTTTTNTVTVQQKYIPKFYKFCFWFVIIQLTAAAFFVAGYFLRFKFKLLNLKK